MTRKEIPLYNMDHLSLSHQKDILISRFAPYLEIHRNLLLAHKHSFYHVLLFTKGGGGHTIDFQHFPVKPYQVYFMIPGQVHSWEFKGHVDGYVVNFSESFFQSFLVKADYLAQFPFLTGNISDSVIQLPKELRSETEVCFKRLLAESESAKPFMMDMIRSILLEMFISIGRLRLPVQDSKVSSHNFTLLKTFQKNIEQHFTTLRMPKDYAEMMYITPNHLNALCREILGIPAGEVIRNRIVLEAKRQLVNLDLSISEIAYKLNFDDNSYFSKFFKKQAGLTPEAFRNEALKKAGPGNIKMK